MTRSFEILGRFDHESDCQKLLYAPLSQRLTPDLLVDDLARRFEERERPLSELILERAIRYLKGEPELVEKKAA